MQNRQDLIRLLMWEGDHFPDVRPVLSRIHQQFQAYLAQYFQRNGKSGFTQVLDKWMLAQLFKGMFFSLTMGNSLLSTPADLAERASDIVHNSVMVFINGIHSTGEEPVDISAQIPIDPKR